MSEETVALKKDALLKAYDEGCQETKTVLKNLYPEIFSKTYKQGQVFLGRHSKDPYIITEVNGSAKIIALPTGTICEVDGQRAATPVRDGTIYIKVEHGVATSVKWDGSI